MVAGLLNNFASCRDSKKTALHDVWGCCVQFTACVASIMAVWSFRDAEPGAHPLGGLCKVLLFSCLYESKWGDSHAASQMIESAFIQRALLPCLCGETCAPATQQPTPTSPQHPISMFSLRPERCTEICDTNQPRGSPAERWRRVISGGKIRSN